MLDGAIRARTDDVARALVTAAVQQRLTSASRLLTCLDRLGPRVPRRRVLRETLADVEGGAQSLPELQFVRLVRRASLPPPELQVLLRLDRRRYLDAVWRAYRLHVEVDGRQHLEVRAWDDDQLRQNEVGIDGWLTLRFPSWIVRRRPELVADQVSRALLARGWRAAP